MSFAAIVLSGVAAAAIISLTGDSANQASALLRSLRDPKSRSLVIRSSSQTKPIAGAIARSLATLPGVDRAVAFPTVTAVTARSLHDPNASAGLISLDVLRGEPPMQLTAGRLPDANEVAVSPGAIRALRITSPLATGIARNDQEMPIVGTFTVGDFGSISDLLANAIVGSSTSTNDYAVVALLAREPADVATIVAAANQLLPDRSGLTVDYEPRAAELQRTVASAGRRNLAALALGIVLVAAIVQLASSLLNAILGRRENARRRALGFTRTEIIFLGAIEGSLLSVFGATVGAMAAWGRLAKLGAPVESSQVAATIGLLAILAALAALPGGAAAALQDPARILRVP
jgi:hypothetical protein